MKKQLLFCAFVGTMTACQHETDIQPTQSTLSEEVAGIYRTNVYLDPSQVAIPTNQMPSAELKKETDSSVTLVYNASYSTNSSQIPHVRLSRQADQIQLQLGDSSIGSLQTDRVFTTSGMEKQGTLLRINIQNDSKNSLTFTGAK
ncbi:hypothetical protein GO730_22995 [Spirosoma sp. HMF3257]|uniref:Uncharacterized protein n=1 Tax=Spirosoma telluris TaxID=2183553 RepID=A0A327NM99_9BACT|nr:hypothetical protein [Spirosoma telluris]RAI76317.1 hypothetical protein HMF3257_22940 [Spirosoma telluris]